MLKKLLFTLLFGVGLCLADACDPLCDCPDVSEYFTFEHLKAKAIYVNYGGDPLRIEILPDSVEYVVAKEPCRSWNGFTTAAYGCSCADMGYKGPKVAITGFDVVADTDFDSNYPAGSSLKSWFKVSANGYWGNYPIDPQYLFEVDQWERVTPFKYGPTQNTITFVMPYAPAITLPDEGIRFTISCNKADGSVAKVVTDPILW